jgi:hypothetical protein
MQEYDATLKTILVRPGSSVLTAIAGVDRLTWLNVETPLVRNLRVDMLGWSGDGELVEIEFQSTNDDDLPVRMGEYLFATGRVHRRLPRQIVLYVGNAPMRMANGIAGTDFWLRYHLVDVRDLDGEALLASANPGDNIIALLTRLGERTDTVLRILERIAAAPDAERSRAMAELLILACLRKRDGAVREEAKKMPILNDIMDSEIFGPLIRQGRAEGRAEGRVEGEVEGRVKGQVALLLRLMEKRFGAVPRRYRTRLAALAPAELESVGLRLMDAERIEDLFAQ